MPSSASLRAAGLLVCLAALSPSPDLNAQLRVRVGGGPLIHEHGRLPRLEAAVHARADATLDLTSVIGLRLGGFVGTGTSLASSSPALGADLAMLVQWREGSAVRPYIGLGLSYTKTDVSGFEPLSYDFGYSIPIGAESRRGWFFEIQPRIFGNVFLAPSATQSMALLTLGWRIS